MPPAESEAQRKFLYATKGKDWVDRHHFNNKGKLPKHKKKRKHSMPRKDSRSFY